PDGASGGAEQEAIAVGKVVYPRFGGPKVWRLVSNRAVDTADDHPTGGAAKEAQLAAIRPARNGPGYDPHSAGGQPQPAADDRPAYSAEGNAVGKAPPAEEFDVAPHRGQPVHNR